MSETETVEETLAHEEEQFVKCSELEAFLTQINGTLLGIVAGINKSISDMNANRSETSDDNED
tara:strand:- start:139 stop:327 length:189 start_codon:yes stop_codon:yes gene_type:complete